VTASTLREPAQARAWETFAHGADVGVRGFGATASEAFANAALALTSVAIDPGRVRPEQAVAITCTAPDLEVLFYDWLNALISRAGADGLVFGRFEVEIEGASLRATVWGEPLVAARHRPEVEVKGATFTGLHVRQGADGTWTAECVVDV
jgi:SHS2 domain-containing protein